MATKPRYMGEIPAEAAEFALEQLFPTDNRYLREFYSWITDRMGEFVWSKQIDIANHVRDNRYTYVTACHGPGKSRVASRIALHWIDCHPPGSAFVVTTAPSWNQIKAILWREIRRGNRKLNIGRITLDCMWYLSDTGSSSFRDEDLIGMGRKPQDYDEQAFQGIHERYVLILIDEACGVPKALFDAAESLMTNDDCRMLAIGNPDDPGAHFADLCKQQPEDVIEISAFDTPAFTGEYCPPEVLEQLTSPRWVEERRKRWGEGSMLWQSKVLGKFPDVSADYLITPAMVDAAIARDLPGYEKGRFGGDIARFGEDESCLYRNRGGVVRRVVAHKKQDTVKTRQEFEAALDAVNTETRVIPAVIDTVGLGAGVYDQLKANGYAVVPFDASEKAFREDRFRNRRAEQWWRLRELFEEGLIDLDPEDEELHGQLTSVKWFIQPGTTRIQVEAKEDMKKRGADSPDRADAVMMSTIDQADVIIHTQRSKDKPQSIAGNIMTRRF